MTPRQSLASAIRQQRRRIVDELCGLEWLADPARPAELITGAAAVRGRVEAFVDALVDGLDSGRWDRFDRVIGKPTLNLLIGGVITQAQLERRSLAIMDVLLPAVTEIDSSPPALLALFEAMQVLSNRIGGEYNRHLAEELRRLDDVKTMFLRITGHELRAPFTVIGGYASMLEEGALGDLPVEARGAVGEIASAARSSLNLLDRLVEVARLEGASEVLSRRSCTLSEVVDEALQPLQGSLRRQSIQVEVEAADESVFVDLEELAIAVRNLVANAVKYAGAGGVIRVRTGIAEGSAVIEVADRGPGIPPDELPRVFERYFRSSRSRQSGMEGSGLGLFIVKRIAELHGGEVEAESRVGEGSVFRIRLPAQAAGA